MKTCRVPFLSLLGFTSALIMSSCEKNVTAPPDFLDGPFPAAPQNLTASVDNGMINLTWIFADSIPAKEFYIYRQDSPAEIARRIGQSQETQFTDPQGLSGNREYDYSVSAVSREGYEGRRSATYYLNAASLIFLLTPVALDTFPVALQLSWTASLDSTNFAAYQIYRAQTPNVDLHSTPIATITNRLRLSYVDRGLKADTDYTYRVYVFNRDSHYGGSNAFTVHTPVDMSPPPVTLAQPAPDSTAGLRLSWSRSVALDFDSYRIFRSTQSPVDLNALPLTIISEAVTTTYADRGLTRGITYYYRVAVYDRAGWFSSSNEVSGSVR